MSADYINRLGNGSRHLREVQQLGARGLPQAGAQPVSDSGSAPAAVPQEGFSPTSEASETPQEQQAGAAHASAIFSAWGNGAVPGANAGQLSVQGAENTTVNQVHSVKDGQHAGSHGPEPGISGGTVYSSRPPQPT